MKSLKTKRIFVLLWVILSISALASVYTLIKSIPYLNTKPLIFWMLIVKLILMGMLLLISINLWKIANSYINKSQWQPLYYQRIYSVGYWGIAYILFNALFESYYETQQWEFAMHLSVNQSVMFCIRRFFTIIFTESSASWVLTLSIFLFAELLQIANQIKAENESII